VNKDHFENVIIGAGPTGLSAAYHLGGDTLLIDKNDKVGGTCRSENDNGFIFDYAGHIIFTKDPNAAELTLRLMADNIHWQEREAWVYCYGTYTLYPFQANTFGLPVEVAKECILGLVEAQKQYPEGGKGAANFEEFMQRHWGAGICKHFMTPYNQKLWTVPLASMSHEWLGGRVPMPSLEEVIDGALRQGTKAMGPNARFGYPLHGGFQSFMNAFLPAIDNVRVDTAVTMIDVRRRRLVLNHVEEVGYDQLISTMPLPELVKIIPDAPRAVIEAAAGLVNVPIYCVNLGIDRPDVTDKHWIYYPEYDFIFQRIFVQGNASPYVKPDGTSSLTLEISRSPYKPVDRDNLLERGIADTVKAGLITAADRILVANVLDLQYAYVVYTPDRQQRVETVRRWLRRHDIHIAGRFAAWEYYNSDGAILAGRNIAQEVATSPLTPAQPVYRVPALPSSDRPVAPLPTGPVPTVPAMPGLAVAGNSHTNGHMNGQHPRDNAAGTSLSDS
jgi:protoporphyrinogen oxidase